MEVTSATVRTYTLANLTQEQFDLIVGCLYVGECGGNERGSEPYYADGEIKNGSISGGSVALEAIPLKLRAESYARLGIRS